MAKKRSWINAGWMPEMPKKAGKRGKVRLANVEALTPQGYRWLLCNVRGATAPTEKGQPFIVTHEGDWAQSLAAAGAKEI